VLAALLVIAGTVAACYGLIEGENFRYAFEPEHYADSGASSDGIQNGLNWVITLNNYLNKQDEWHYQYALDRLAEPYPFFYHVTQGEVVLTNIEASDIEAFFTALPSYQKQSISNGGVAYAGVSQEVYNKMAADYAINRKKGLEGFYFTLAGFVACILGLGYVMYSAGEQHHSKEISLSTLDRMYLDIGLVVMGFLALGGLSLLAQIWRLINQVGHHLGLLLTGGVVAAMLALVGLQYASTVAKRIRRREFFSHTLVYTVCSWFFSTFSNILHTGSLAVRAVGLLLIYAVGIFISLIMLVFSSISSRGEFGVGLLGLCLFGLVNIFAIKFVTKRAGDLKALLQGTERIRQGDLAYRINQSGSGAFADLAKSVNNIAQGLQAAVESEVKSERMKAELITNVSHDLKTPLTSIITYVDLLKTEGLASDNAPRYLDVLDQKSQRLKVLTEDLFEAAKAASGTIAMKVDRIDVASLLTQGMAELSDKVAASGLDFRISTTSDKLYVKADGRLLWRAMENILSNAMKYAMPGSRVYVDCYKKGEQVHLVIKNISACPLNIPPEELVERFKRGDESRTTEGSGLGLSIAKSLVELQKGIFKVEIDGDLFKVTMSLPIYKE